MTQNAEAAAVQLAQILLEAIHEAGPQGIPSGHLYAAVMSKIDIHVYNTVIGTLKRVGFITEENHVLKSTAKR